MRLPIPAVALGAALASACTITSMGPEDGPPRIESRGLIEGHAAVGMRDEDDFFRLKLLDGQSDGALAEVVVWKLFRLEVGALGAGVGIGPFDLALGTLFYEADLPPMESEKKAVSASAPTSRPEECEICRQAEEQAKAKAKD